MLLIYCFVPSIQRIEVNNVLINQQSNNTSVLVAFLLYNRLNNLGICKYILY